jgi:hypothetical protein
MPRFNAGRVDLRQMSAAGAAHAYQGKVAIKGNNDLFPT